LLILEMSLSIDSAVLVLCLFVIGSEERLQNDLFLCRVGRKTVTQSVGSTVQSSDNLCCLLQAVIIKPVSRGKEGRCCTTTTKCYSLKSVCRYRIQLIVVY